MKALPILLTSFILTLTLCLHTHAQETAWDRVEKIEKGYNLSGWLEAGWLGADYPNPNAYTEDELILLAELGFKTVRVPVLYEWIVTEHSPFDTITYQVPFDIIDNTIIPIAEQYGMTVILDNHHGMEMTNDNFMAELPRVCGQWKFLAQLYADLPHDRYFFDLKGGYLGLSPQNLLTVQQAIIDTIRVYDTDRTLLARWFDTGTPACNDTQDNIIYGLYDFQNASFVQGGDTLLRNRLIAAKDWSDTHNTPVIIHEFGIDYGSVDESVRCDYIETITHLSDSLDIPWIYWDLKGANSIFNNYTIHQDSLIECFGDAMELPATSPPLPVSLVLPGDFNNDNIVTVTDVMYMRQAERNEGPARLNPTIDYIPQPALDWDEDAYGVNNKHQDGNGDGIVNEDDLEALRQNYCIVCVEDIQLQETSNFRAVHRDTIIGSQPGHIYEIYIDNLDAVSGVSFRLEYGLYGRMRHNITIDIQNSWLMPSPSDTIWVHDVDLQRIDIAINSADNIEQVNSGQPVAYIVTIEDVLKDNALKSASPKFEVSNGVAATSDMIIGIKDWEYNPIIVEPEIDVYPNPVYSKSNLNIRLREQNWTGNADLMVVDIYGNVITNQQVYINSGEVMTVTGHVPMSKLKSGIYFVRLKSETWQSKPQKLMYLY